MEKNFYMINMQKLLFMVKELHTSGFGKLRVEPSLSPSGCSWRCNFVDTDTKRQQLAASGWLYGYSKEFDNKEIQYSPRELADFFQRENSDFLKFCIGEDKEYAEWYENMLEQLEEGELPYAFAEYFSPTNFWKTSKGNEIKTLSNEIQYYVNY